MRAFRMALTIGLAAMLGATSCSGPDNGSSLEKIGSDGLTANGLTANGLTANGLTANGLTANGLTANGLTANGLTANGLTANGLTANGLTANGLTANGLTPADVITNDATAREFFKYVYSCAMPSSASVTLNGFTFSGGLGLAPEWGTEG